jgi:hypothetical protein
MAMCMASVSPVTTTSHCVHDARELAQRVVAAGPSARAAAAAARRAFALDLLGPAQQEDAVAARRAGAR